MSHSLQARVEAAQATIDRFKDKPLVWGRYDCARMAAFCLKQLGHEISVASWGAYSNSKSARRRLAAAGYTDVGDALDALGLFQIPPAMAWPGDILRIPGHTSLGTLAVRLTNGRALAFCGAPAACHVIQPLKFLAAWRA